MEFRDAIRDVVEGAEGAIAGILMDSQGIAVESYARDGGGVDIASIGAEYSVILRSVQDAAKSLATGGTDEVSVQAERVTTLIRVVTDEYFVALALGPGANVGKARFLLRVATPRLREALA